MQVNWHQHQTEFVHYAGEVVKPIGEVELEFTYNNQKAVSSVIIMKGSYLNLLGRDILRKVKLNWEELFKNDNWEETVKFVDNVNSNRILSRYKSVFDNDLGTLKNVEVTLTVKSDAIPKFCRACPIPYALKDSWKRAWTSCYRRNTQTYFSFWMGCPNN